MLRSTKKEVNRVVEACQSFQVSKVPRKSLINKDEQCSLPTLLCKEGPEASRLIVKLESLLWPISSKLKVLGGHRREPCSLSAHVADNRGV